MERETGRTMSHGNRLHCSRDHGDQLFQASVLLHFRQQAREQSHRMASLGRSDTFGVPPCAQR